MNNAIATGISLHRIKTVPSLTSRQRTGGFTLVEMLIVVGVLLFIIAMLVPALTKAQRQSRTITCLSNLHQLYLGYSTYLSQQPQRTLGCVRTEQGAWTNVLAPTFPDVKNILLCPEARSPSYGQGGERSAWGPFDSAHGSPTADSWLGKNSSGYGFNGWLYGKDDHAESSSHAVVFADATWIDAWPVSGSPTVADIPPISQSNEDGFAKFDISRHGHSINMSFLDGHAEQVPLEHLREQPWTIR